MIAEAFSAGTEVECAVIGLYEAEASVPGEVVLVGGAEWYDYEAKYSPGGVELRVPAAIPEAAAGERPPAGGRDVPARRLRRARARRLLRRGRRPGARQRAQHAAGMTPTSAFPKLWEAAGVPWPEACERLLQIALERHRVERGASRVLRRSTLVSPALT